MCTLTSILFLGGYLTNTLFFFNENISGIILGIKSSIMIFTFIWVRASFPRIRFDQLMSYCWTKLLPLIVGIIILIPCIIYLLNSIPFNAYLI
jgi:NADH-ubiquinone oxidoreductase chain 1